MQTIYHAIFHKAVEEVPHLLKSFGTEQCILYKGFKVSRKNGDYSWKDIRNSNFYEDVDPFITEKILTNGFCKTLQEVLKHDDENKIKRIDRMILNIDKEVENYVVLATLEYTELQANIKALAKKSLSKSQIQTKTASLNRRFQTKKRLYAKKRRILKEQKAELLSEKAFINSRIIN